MLPADMQLSEQLLIIYKYLYECGNNSLDVHVLRFSRYFVLSMIVRMVILDDPEPTVQ